METKLYIYKTKQRNGKIDKEQNLNITNCNKTKGEDEKQLNKTLITQQLKKSLKNTYLYAAIQINKHFIQFSIRGTGKIKVISKFMEHLFYVLIILHS